jgi:hypothetical protein
MTPTVDELRSALVAALEGVADQLPEAPPGEKVDPASWLDVRSSGLAGALACPAADALDGETPFEEAPALVGRRATSTVLDRIVHGHLDPSRGKPPSDPATGFRTALREVEHLDWPWPWVHQATRAEKAMTAAEVHRRAGAIARMLDPWPVDVTHVGLPTTWTFPGRTLRLKGWADAVVGKRGRDHTLVVALGGDHSSATRARLAFEAVVDALQCRRVPGAVLALLPDAGRRWQVTVDDGLLVDGIAAAAVGARAALGARRRDASGLERRPGPRCRTCAHAGACAEGAAWLAGPGRLRAGFLPHDAPLG